MLTDYFSAFKGEWKSPDQLAQKLKFNVEGMIIWSSLPDVVQFKLEKRLYGRFDNEIKKSLDSPDRAVLLQVDHYHWVVALGKSFFGGYKVADPWTGLKTIVPSKAYKTITGSAHMILI